MTPPDGVRESGAATVLVVAMAGVLMFVLVGVSAVGGLVTSQRRTQAAADLAALAAAAELAGDGSGGGPCARAGRVAGANAAALEECVVDGRSVTVVVSASGPHLPWSSRWSRVRVSAEARAGPA
ncbi:Rv3654c family TadE-like protein [Nocardioides xinjiangensis]|uniref:Rv3654c family TadE-like protein n=1 Tax=Nocardioides xinjiangensis TaxID=2817376 RepID=UPI001B311C4E|nr:MULTISPECIES: Rv3654c family TadE-like protein [unclassified Nocardioides]